MCEAVAVRARSKGERDSDALARQTGALREPFAQDSRRQGDPAGMPSAQARHDGVARRLFDHPRGLKGSPAPIYENYDPITGRGLNVRHFSWSAAHLLMLYKGL